MVQESTPQLPCGACRPLVAHQSGGHVCSRPLLATAHMAPCALDIWGLSGDRVRRFHRLLSVRTDKEFESYFRGHFRVPPHVLSTGVHVLIPVGWAQMSSHPPRAAASARLPAREEPRGQTERSHLALVRGPNTSAPRHHEGFRQQPRRTGLAPSVRVSGAMGQPPV